MGDDQTPLQPYGDNGPSTVVMHGTRRLSSGGAWQPPSVGDLQIYFPRYEILGILGRGGMGAVYKGCQKSLDRIVAIKIFPASCEDDGMHYAERFKQEAKAMAKFRHPGIVSVYDAGETQDGLMYFIMEYIEGTDVAKLIATQGRLAPAQALSIIAQVCAALAYAHQHGVVHRDIKPSNVMIEPDGTVKVADFGLARFSGPDGGMDTTSNVSVGTPDFMSPEAFDGTGRVDHRADLYAAGGMLYQMLTGKAPHGRFVPPSVAVLGLDPQLDGIVDKAMQADPEKRYTTAVEMQAEVAHLASSDGRRAAATSKSSAGLRPWVKPVLVGALAAAMLGIAAGGIRIWKNGRSATPGADGRQPGAGVPAVAGKSPWRDAFAESPLREVIAKAMHTADGYSLPGNNHWEVSPRFQNSAALRIRATDAGGKFASIYIRHEDRAQERIRFRSQNGGEWLLSARTGDGEEADFAAKSAESPLDGRPHELLLARVGGRLRVLLDGRPLMDEADPNPAPGRFVLDIFSSATACVDRVEYADFDGVPESEALKLLGIVKK